MSKAYLTLENGEIFEGESFGASGETVGELVFTTAMVGYLETLTDPSYFGQIVTQTFPLIGNYGVIPEDFESSHPYLKAYIVRDLCQEPSNFRSCGDLDTFLKENGIVGLCGVDTRRLTRIVRESGTMAAKIGASPADPAALASFRIKDAVESTTCSAPATFTPEATRYRVALLDFGAKDNIRRELVKRGCEVTVLPASTTAAEVLALSPDGIMLSNGPGDPAENTGIIAELAKLLDSGVPMFGICLGHQLTALAAGAKTAKLKYGHRGANQPVVEKATGRVYITSQNHGYAVLGDTLPSFARESFVNANDGTCEGVDYEGRPVFTVQFHPEACAGPLDTAFLFDRFTAMMEVNKNAGK